MDLAQIKNIIFDLGGVIINIDYNRSIAELQKLCKNNCNVAYSQREQAQLFDMFETGASSPGQFRDELRNAYGITAPDEEIDKAWNAMLLDIPQERIDLLMELGKRYRIFLLSNTNAIHLTRFNEIVAHSFTIPSLDSLFEQSYYSHLIGKRKPDALVFEEIIAMNGLQKDETLFIDDSIQHIESASKVGLQTLHLQPSLTINQFFKDVIV
ncbi:HAD family phosphatase [Pontibacter sp. E15-1]|uniref:HAD family hydrolase n=1 Tax=Pontibacter sp. E15-1 TaxID=2919918 RepID=UPI001F500694|nr:HAD family phosphatase [Pontibacter sp. E15-1]MCJ8165898.1 HAD family phosphatase [Pontibacter sp. E15-1]